MKGYLSEEFEVREGIARLLRIVRHSVLPQ